MKRPLVLLTILALAAASPRSAHAQALPNATWPMYRYSSDHNTRGGSAALTVQIVPAC
jgi:hypothetical protein